MVDGSPRCAGELVKVASDGFGRKGVDVEVGLDEVVVGNGRVDSGCGVVVEVGK